MFDLYFWAGKSSQQDMRLANALVDALKLVLLIGMCTLLLYHAISGFRCFGLLMPLLPLLLFLFSSLPYTNDNLISSLLGV